MPPEYLKILKWEKYLFSHYKRWVCWIAIEQTYFGYSPLHKHNLLPICHRCYPSVNVSVLLLNLKYPKYLSLFIWIPKLPWCKEKRKRLTYSAPAPARTHLFLLVSLPHGRTSRGDDGRAASVRPSPAPPDESTSDHSGVYPDSSPRPLPNYIKPRGETVDNCKTSVTAPFAAIPYATGKEDNLVAAGTPCGPHRESQRQWQPVTRLTWVRGPWMQLGYWRRGRRGASQQWCCTCPSSCQRGRCQGGGHWRWFCSRCRQAVVPWSMVPS